MNIKIEGQEFHANEGDTILDVARRNNIQIPTICYLSGCSPTLACKMCMVEVNGKRVYSCNAKVKDGMEVVVHNEELRKDRNEIMTTYCVNHPLECGVCDKSGECELQDFTLYTKVDIQQFGLQEADKKSYSFAQSFYDPALCIMCERCVTTCKDNIGEANLKAGKANLFTPDNYKDSMGKDPYSVWAKRQKGLIEFVGKNECKDCGECISVCPVGAMTYKDFTYTSNAWELEKVHSTCAHCAMGCSITYNVKHLDVKGDLQKVYRVQNDFLYNPICGAGRFAFDSVSVGSRDLSATLKAFRAADSIHIGSEASNEEAFLANLIAKKLDIPLINNEARNLQIFQSHFVSAFKIYGESKLAFANFEDVKNAPTFIALDSYFKYDAPALRYKINNNLKMLKNTQLLSIASFQDSLLQGLGKNVAQICVAPENVAIAGILGLVFANDLIDDFEEAFPSALSAFVREGSVRADSQNMDCHAYARNDESSDTATQSSNNQSSLRGEAEAIHNDEANTTDSKAQNAESQTADSQEVVDNLTPYDLSSILAALNVENLESLKVAKPKDSKSDTKGVLLISQHTLEGFLSSDIKHSSSYEIALNHSEANKPSILEAVSATIAEGLTQNITDVLLDRGTKLQILSHLLAFIAQKLSLKLLYIPKGANTLGIANICELSSSHFIESQYSIGIRTKGHFVLDSNLPTIKPNFPLPTLAQSEGSITSMEMRVLPLNPSIPYLDSNLLSAYDLCDIARELEAFDDDLCGVEYMGDITQHLGKSQGNFAYHNTPLIDLAARFERDGRDMRGYMLEARLGASSRLDMKFSLRLQPPKDSQKDSHNTLALLLETQNHFSHTTQNSANLQSKSGIYANKAMLDSLGLQEGDSITLRNGFGEISGCVYCDYEIMDSILLVSPLIAGVAQLFCDGMYASVSVAAQSKGSTKAAALETIEA